MIERYTYYTNYKGADHTYLGQYSIAYYNTEWIVRNQYMYYGGIHCGPDHSDVLHIAYNYYVHLIESVAYNRCLKTTERDLAFRFRYYYSWVYNPNFPGELYHAETYPVIDLVLEDTGYVCGTYVQYYLGYYPWGTPPPITDTYHYEFTGYFVSYGYNVYDHYCSYRHFFFVPDNYLIRERTESIERYAYFGIDCIGRYVFQYRLGIPVAYYYYAYLAKHYYSDRYI